MNSKPNHDQSDEQSNPQSNRIKDPEQWTTGDEPMTGAQQSYLETLSGEAGEKVEEDLTKAEASKRIEELQEKTGCAISCKLQGASQKASQGKRTTTECQKLR